MSAHRFGIRRQALVSVLALAAATGQAEAQQTAPPPQVSPGQATTGQAAPPAQVKAKSKTSTSGAEAVATGTGAAASASASSSGGDQALKKRVEQLEAQLVDMQVVIGTLESLARSGVRPPAAPVGTSAGLSGPDQARIDSLETQIRALSAQVEQLSQGRRSDVRPPAGSTGSVAGDLAPASEARIGQWSPPDATQPATLPPVADGSEAQGGARFGAGAVTAGSLDPIGPQDGAGASTGASAGVGAAPGAAGAAAPQVAAADPMPQNPKQLYEQAYGFLLQQNYASAQAGFSAFLKNYPKDGLAPNALYWLGETHYVQRNYADAAEAFDLVTSAYGASIKAPDAQLKRGMSLAQLGKKQEACTAFRDLGTKFPSAPVHIKQKADAERQRNACP